MAEWLTTYAFGAIDGSECRGVHGLIVANDRADAERIALTIRDHLGGPVRVEGERGKTTWDMLPPNILSPVDDAGNPATPAHPDWARTVMKPRHLKAVD